MAESIQFFVDEHIYGAVVQGLRLRGIDLLTANEADRSGVPDPDQLAFAEGTMGRRIRVPKQSK